MKKGKKVLSMQEVSDLFDVSGLTSKTPLKRKGEHRYSIEAGGEIVHEVIQPRKKGIPDTELIRKIYQCLEDDKYFKPGGVIVLTRISKEISKEIADKSDWHDSERNIRERIKKLFPIFIGVIKFNGTYYYKNHPKYSPPKRPE